MSFADANEFIRASLFNELGSLQNSSMLSIPVLAGGARCGGFVMGFGRLKRERSACSFRNAFLQPRGLSVLKIFERLAWWGSSWGRHQGKNALGMTGGRAIMEKGREAGRWLRGPASHRPPVRFFRFFK